MSTLLHSPHTNQFRAGWRILFFVALFMISAISLQLIIKGMLGGLPPKGLLREATIVIIAAISATVTMPYALKWFNKLKITDIGLEWNGKALKDLLFGFALSLFMASSVFAILLITGQIEFQSINWASSIGLSEMNLTTLGFLLLICISVGWWEELVFRGYVFQNMVMGLGQNVAIGISCLLYGVIHMANPNASVLSFIIIMIFGYLRLYGYLKTKQLWLSIGMHIGWNFFQGPIFGFAASGNTSPILISHQAIGPEYLTGAEFGPEASLVTIPIIMITIGLMKWWSERNYTH